MWRRVILKKAISGPRIGTLRAKWLKELEREEDFRAFTRFVECYISILYKTATKRFFIKD